MGTYAQQGSFTLNTATGNQSVTGIGFTPKIVIFWGCQFLNGTTGQQVAGAAEARRCYGGATSSSNQFVALTSVNAYNKYVSRQVITSKCIRFNDALSDSAICEASFVSLDSNGFTINVTTGAAVSINYLALGGTNLNAYIGYFDAPAQADPFNQSVTGVGFQPKALITVTGPQFPVGTSSLETHDGTDGVNVGFTDGTNQESTTHFYQSTAPLAVRSNKAGRCLLFMNYTGDGYDAVAYLSSFDTDGFTLSYTAKWSGGLIRIPFIALGGSAQFQVGGITEPTVTGTQTVSVSSTMKPIATLFMSIGIADENGNIDADSRFSFGASANISQQTAVSFSLPGTNTPSTYDGFGNTNTSYALAFDNYTTPTTWASLGTVTAQTTGSFTVNWNTVSGSSYRYSYLTISDAKSNPSRTMIGIFN